MSSRAPKKSSRRQLQKAETRRLIMAAAYSLFGRKGYENTTMRELAAQADVGLGTIFKHFPDKPSLLINVYREDLEAVLHNTFATLPSTNIKMQLAHIATELYVFLGQAPSLSRSIVRESIFHHDLQDMTFARQTTAFREQIEELLLKARLRGEIDPGTDCRAGALAFLSFFLLGLIRGLREPVLDAKKQTFFLASMLESYFTSSRKSPD